jgi:hypothetical protein
MCSGKIAVISLLVPHKTGHMNSLPVLCGTSRERTAIFPEHMNSPPVLCGTSRERSLLIPHKTGGEFMCSGKIAVFSLLIPHKTGGEFMYLSRTHELTPCFVWD